MPVLRGVAHGAYAALLWPTAAGCLVPDTLRLQTPTHAVLAVAAALAYA
jgi:hypothetical protein